MALTTEQVKEIASYLNYSYSQREWLGEVLSVKSNQYGEDWEDEVSDLLVAINTAKEELDASISEGGIKAYRIDDIAIEYETNGNPLIGKKTIYNNLLARLSRLLEIDRQTSSSYLVR